MKIGQYCYKEISPIIELIPPGKVFNNGDLVDAYNGYSLLGSSETISCLKNHQTPGPHPAPDQQLTRATPHQWVASQSYRHNQDANSISVVLIMTTQSPAPIQVTVDYACPARINRKSNFICILVFLLLFLNLCIIYFLFLFLFSIFYLSVFVTALLFSLYNKKGYIWC